MPMRELIETGVNGECTERLQFPRNVGKIARMRSQCVPGSQYIYVVRFQAEEVGHAS